MTQVEAGSRHYAGFWIRVVAHVIDEVVLLVASQALTYGTLFSLYLLSRIFQATAAASFSEAFSGGMIQIVNVLASFALSLPYYVAFTHLKGATIGKMALRIQVIDESTGQFPSVGQAIGRFFASILSAVLFGAGYIMVAFNPQKKALHDTLAGTVSIYREEEAPQEIASKDTEGEGPVL